MIYTKNLNYCDSIDRILISEKINCDAIIISDETLQYTLLYRSEIAKTFTDNLIKSGLYYLIRQYMIKSIPDKISTRSLSSVKKSLSGINISITAFEMINSTKNYISDTKKINSLKLPKYVKFYSTKSNSFIYLNNDLIDTNFDDILQISIDPDKLCGLYNSIGNNYSVVIYKEYIDGNYKIKNIIKE